MSITLGLTKLIIIEFIQNISLFLTGLISPANSVQPANIDHINKEDICRVFIKNSSSRRKV